MGYMTINDGLSVLLKEWQQFNIDIENKTIEQDSKIALNFTPFKFIWTNEDGISEIIAYLLDPREKHSQKTYF
ncbi:hypothetical protein C5N92_10535 [Glaesserella australis]|uniref:Uncharacterized protein n=2 Tax=Pasteurellaceae TaxID=712 RepID=A0A328BYH8_9PAST|nr:hypothetical protein CJD39_09070 [Glaesserella sp. 15-184]RAL17890.1 hypothetical protein C5N92_10535 [Glaesserella australis]